MARVAPLYKNDDKLQVQNYRPISVLPAISKVIERVVHTQLSLLVRESLAHRPERVKLVTH